MADKIPFKRPELKDIQPKNNQGSGIKTIDRTSGSAQGEKDYSNVLRGVNSQNLGQNVAARDRCKSNLPSQEGSNVVVSPDRRSGLAPSDNSGIDKSDKSLRKSLSLNAPGLLASGTSAEQPVPRTKLPSSSGANYVPPVGGDGGIAGGSTIPRDSPGSGQSGGSGTSIPGGGGIPSAGGGGSSSVQPISPRDLQSPPSEPLGGSSPSGGEVPGGAPGGQPSGPAEPGTPGSPEDDNVATIVDTPRWTVPVYVATFVPFTGLCSEFGDNYVRLDTLATSNPVNISDVQPPFIAVVYPVDSSSMPNAIKCKPQYFLSGVGWRKDRISSNSMVDFSSSDSESIGGLIKVPICVVITILRKDGNDSADNEGSTNLRTLKRSYFLGTYDIINGSQNSLQIPSPFDKAISNDDMRRIRTKIAREVITGYRMKTQGEINPIGPWIGDYLMGFYHKHYGYNITDEVAGDDKEYFIGGTVIYEQEYPNVTPVMALFKRAHSFSGNIDNIDAMALYTAVITAYSGIKTRPEDSTQWSRPYGIMNYDLIQVRSIRMSSTSPIILVQALATANLISDSLDGQWYISPMDDELLYQKDIDDNYRAVVSIRYVRYKKPLALLKIAYANANGMPTSGEVRFTTFSYDNDFPFYFTARFSTGIISPTNASFSFHVPIAGFAQITGTVSLQLDAYVRGDTQLTNLPSKEYHAIRPVFTKPMVYVDEYAVSVADGTDVARDVAFGKIFIPNPKPTSNDIGTYTNHAILCLGNCVMLLGAVEPSMSPDTRMVSLRLSKYCTKDLDSAKVMIDGVVVQPTNLVKFDGLALFKTVLRMHKYYPIYVQTKNGRGNVKISIGQVYQAYRPTSRIYTSTQNNKMGYAHLPNLPVNGSITASQEALPKWVGTREGTVLPIGGSGSGPTAPQVAQSYQGHNVVGWLSLFSLPMLEVQNDYVITRDAISLTPHALNSQTDVMSSLVQVVSFPTYVIPKGVYIRNDANTNARNAHIVEGYMVSIDQYGNYTFRESSNKLLRRDTAMMKTYHQNVYSNSIYNDPNISKALKDNGYYIPIYIYTDVPAPFVYPDVDNVTNLRFYVWKIKLDNRTLIVRPIFPYCKILYDDRKIPHFVPVTLVSML